MFDMYLERSRKRISRYKNKKLYFLSLAAIVGFVGLALGTLFIMFLFIWYAKDLPRPDKIKRTEGLSTVVLDRNEVKLYDIFEDENRIPVKFEDIPLHLKNATIAIEDKNFYKHQGLSQSGLFRAMINIFVFRNLQGGSTLTQQLVKNVLLTSERTIPRKIKEAILALQIERKYTKDEILQMYLNEAPYGGTAIGVESAAQYYFGKPVRDLGLIECAIIAGLPQAPSRYSPFTGQDNAYVWRTQQVLRRMREDGYLSKDQEKSASDQLENVKFVDTSKTLKAPHFVAYVQELLEDKLGKKVVDAGGLTVTTTLDWDIQEQAQTIVAEEVDKAKKLQVSNGAAVVINPKDGEILAMVGSRDYSATDAAGLKFNVVTQGLRQPGSAIKPITYATAFKKGYTASTMLMDLLTKYPSGFSDQPEYEPKNYDLKYRGPTQLRYALGNSINTIAVKLSALVGIRDILETAYDLGIDSLEPTSQLLKRVGLSLTLGGGEVKLIELTGAYGVFAAGGLRSDPVAILKVINAQGKTIYEHKPANPRRVLPEDVSYLISHILSDNNARKQIFGTNSYLYIAGRNVAVKTGTTDDKRDNWTIGYTPSRVVGVWVGNNDNSPMHPSLSSGVTGAAPIWAKLIKYVLSDLPNEDFSRPVNIVELDIDEFGGGLPVEGGSTRKEIFIKGTEPTGPAIVYQKIRVSIKDENRLANAVEINKGEYKEKLFIVIKEDDPVSSDGVNRWQEPINAWIGAQGDSKFHPPTETYNEGDKLAVHIVKPNDLSRIDSNDIEVVANAAGFKKVTLMEIYVDEEKVRDSNDSRINETLNLTDGSHKIKVKAIDEDGNSSERVVKVGIKQDYADPTPSPTEEITSTPTPTP